MSQSLALPYSKALFQLGLSQGKGQELLHALEEFLDLLHQKPSLKQLLTHPFIEEQEKKELLRRVWEGQSLSFLLPFFSLLIDKKRFDQLEEIVAGFRQMVHHQLGILSAEVATAVPLDEENKERLRGKLEAFYKKKVELSLKTDPKILGGMRITVGDQILDRSIKNQLFTLKHALMRG